jgi:hypothetical protein
VMIGDCIETPHGGKDTAMAEIKGELE